MTFITERPLSKPSSDLVASLVTDGRCLRRFANPHLPDALPDARTGTADLSAINHLLRI
jgi:hypothetical protein